MQAFAVFALSCLVLAGSCTAMNVAQPFGEPFAHPHPTHPGAVPPTFTDTDVSCSEGYCYYIGISAVAKEGGGVKFCSTPFFGYYAAVNVTETGTVVCPGSESWDATVDFVNIDTEDWSATVTIEGSGSVEVRADQVYDNSYSQVGSSGLFVTGYAYDYSASPNYCARLCNE